jgi:hypothetical protein
MKRAYRVLVDVRDLMQHRVAVLAAGRPLDPMVDAAATRILMAELVAVGLVEDGRWFRLPVVPLDRASLAGVVDSLAIEVLGRVVRVFDAKTRVRESVAASFVRDVACLVVEMAALSATVTAIHEGCSTVMSRKRRVRHRASLDPAAMVRVAACCRDPEAFLAEAEARLEAAVEDIERAKSRIRHLKAGRVKDRLVPGVVLASVEDPASRALSVSALPPTLDLFVGSPPVKSPGQRVARRRASRLRRASAVERSLASPRL